MTCGPQKLPIKKRKKPITGINEKYLFMDIETEIKKRFKFEKSEIAGITFWLAIDNTTGEYLTVLGKDGITRRTHFSSVYMAKRYIKEKYGYNYQ